jgi:hypothetical protein
VDSFLLAGPISAPLRVPPERPFQPASRIGDSSKFVPSPDSRSLVARLESFDEHEVLNALEELTAALALEPTAFNPELAIVVGLVERRWSREHLNHEDELRYYTIPGRIPEASHHVAERCRAIVHSGVTQFGSGTSFDARELSLVCAMFVSGIYPSTFTHGEHRYPEPSPDAMSAYRRNSLIVDRALSLSTIFAREFVVFAQICWSHHRRGDALVFLDRARHLFSNESLHYCALVGKDLSPTAPSIGESNALTWFYWAECHQHLALVASEDRELNDRDVETCVDHAALVDPGNPVDHVAHVFDHVNHTDVEARVDHAHVDHAYVDHAHVDLGNPVDHVGLAIHGYEVFLAEAPSFQPFSVYVLEDHYIYTRNYPPSSARALTALGCLRELLLNLDGAESAYLDSIALDPTSFDTPYVHVAKLDRRRSDEIAASRQEDSLWRVHGGFPLRRNVPVGLQLLLCEWFNNRVRQLWTERSEHSLQQCKVAIKVSEATFHALENVREADWTSMPSSPKEARSARREVQPFAWSQRGDRLRSLEDAVLVMKMLQAEIATVRYRDFWQARTLYENILLAHPDYLPALEQLLAVEDLQRSPQRASPIRLAGWKGRSGGTRSGAEMGPSA